MCTSTDNSFFCSPEYPHIVGTIVLLLMLISLIFIFNKLFGLLKAQGWSLKETLSDYETFPIPPQNVATPTPTQAQAPAQVQAPATQPNEKKPVDSSSRFIALNGMIPIGTIYIATGFYIIFTLFNGDTQGTSNLSANLTAVDNFLLYGAGLFVPYVFNKLSSVGKTS